MRILIVLVLALAACGGSKKPATRAAAPGGGSAMMEAPKADANKDSGAETSPPPAPTGADPCQGGEKP
jgi:hypothetical protein